MNVNFHNVENVQITKRTHGTTLATLSLTFTDSNGNDLEICLFTDDMSKLNINTATVKTEAF